MFTICYANRWTTRLCRVEPDRSQWVQHKIVPRKRAKVSSRFGRSSIFTCSEAKV